MTSRSSPDAPAVCVMGIFVADLAFTADRLPRMGETLLGGGFRMGPGGKGSNQAVAAAKAARGRGAVGLVTRIGADAFAAEAHKVWTASGLDVSNVLEDETRPTGAAFIFVSAETGDNAIIVEPGASRALSPDDMIAARAAIEGAKVFVTQLEQPLEAARAALRLARDAGAATVLNPAPARALDDEVLALCDYLTPNESETEALTGLSVSTLDEARTAADALLKRGVGAAVLTLGERGALYHDGRTSEVVPAYRASNVVDTTGAGDAFNGAFAVALSEGRAPLEAVRFGCAAASISVTRPGAAASSPVRAEIEALIAAHASQ